MPAQHGYQQPAYAPPPANPYGGYSQAPVYAGGGGPAYPGSLAYVEQNFGKVADFGQRALAYLIDTAITLIGLIPMVIGIIVLARRRLRQPSAPTSSATSPRRATATPALAVVGGLLIALGALVSIGITIWNRVFKMGRTGQSVGKKVIGLYLLDDKTGQPIGAGMCFLRELVQGLVNQIFYLGWLWMLWDADKQTLGDKAVHSSVVVVPKTLTQAVEGESQVQPGTLRATVNDDERRRPAAAGSQVGGFQRSCSAAPPGDHPAHEQPGDAEEIGTASGLRATPRPGRRGRASCVARSIPQPGQ